MSTFDANIEPVPVTGCMLWAGNWGKHGYGLTTAGGKLQSAHKYAWEREHGPVPPGLMLRHQCDARACVNTAHLLLGTAAQNSADMVQRGRSGAGARNPSVRLNETQVAAIRAAEGTYTVIARAHGVARSHAWNIKNDKKWKGA